MEPIVVAGATGRIGSLVVDGLLRRGHEVRAGARTPDRIANTGIQRVAMDAHDPQSLREVFAGARKAFLYSVPGAGETLAQAAAEAGVEHVVLLSSHSSSEVDRIPERQPIAQMHAAMEEALTNVGVVTTFLRPAHFATNVLLWGWDDMVKRDNVIRFPYPASECDAIHERDIAECAAVALTAAGHEGTAHFITGPASISQAAQAERIGQALGSTVRFEEISPHAARAQLGQYIPGWVMDATLAYWAASDGVATETTGTVEEILGRPALGVDVWARDHVNDFRA